MFLSSDMCLISGDLNFTLSRAKVWGPNVVGDYLVDFLVGILRNVGWWILILLN